MSNAMSEIEQTAFLTTREAAVRARTTGTTIRKWIECGRLEAARPGKRYLVSARSLQAALAPIGRREEE